MPPNVIPKWYETLQIRVHGPAQLPALIYLPGLHGDWTLIGGLRTALAGRVRFVEFTYPRTLAWSLDDYAAAIESRLLEQGITRGWLLGESFGSQIVWPLVRRAKGEGRGASEGSGPSLVPHTAHFQADGVILAGGFVRHPTIWGVRLVGALCAGISVAWLARLFYLYARCARCGYRRSPEMVAGFQEFIARRTEPDKAAMRHRLDLIAGNDARPLARVVTMPVWYLNGAWDPVVPWPAARRWLRHHCPGYRGGRTLWLADHTVLASAWHESAEQIIRWMGAPDRH